VTQAGLWKSGFPWSLWMDVMDDGCSRSFRSHEDNVLYTTIQ
jgi:hypothetical protein